MSTAAMSAPVAVNRACLGLRACGVPRGVRRVASPWQNRGGFPPRLTARPCGTQKRLPPCQARFSNTPSSNPLDISNPIGVHALVWTGTWEEADVRLAVEGSANCGYDLIEVPLLEPETVNPAMTKRILEEFDMRASTSLGLNFNADISSEDPAVVARGEALLDAALKVTDAIGGNIMTGVIYSAIGKYATPASALSRSNSVAAIQRLADKAADRGVTLGLEVINRYETNLLNTATQGMEFLADVNRDNVVIHLDSFHMHIEESGLAQAVRACGDKLGYVHIGESHRGYLGSGNVDFPQLFRALVQAGYTGPITFESFSSRVVSRTLSSYLCVWR
eukprot:jgi/Mesvir1/14045/Mv03118-RA.2